MSQVITEESISPQQEEALERIFQEYAGKKGALIQVLHAVQNVLGYLPREALKKVAQALDIPLSEVYGVVTFYHFFSMKPRGKHVIQVCLGTACYVRGGQAILDKLRKDLEVDIGSITSDGLYSLEVMRCAGACGLAPVVRIDNDVHKRVSPSQIMDIIKSYE
ncbi:MAG: NADH-quinone oxidoreductase subunit NuoE [Candidatus Atribacteria bacterium]|nr:NADH-quinone oxidoreductase subunit NuoE [Candidatus Atribacteria bacterium]